MNSAAEDRPNAHTSKIVAAQRAKACLVATPYEIEVRAFLGMFLRKSRGFLLNLWLSLFRRMSYVAPLMTLLAGAISASWCPLVWPIQGSESMIRLTTHGCENSNEACAGWVGSTIGRLFTPSNSTFRSRGIRL